MSTHLSSPHNPHFKDALKLEKRSERTRCRLTRVEGGREVSRALAAGIVPVEAYICPELVDAQALGSGLAQLHPLDAARRRRLFTVPAEQPGLCAPRSTDSAPT